MRGFLLPALITLLLAATAAAGLPVDVPEPVANDPVEGFAVNPTAGAYFVHRNPDVEAKLKGMAEANPEFATVTSAGKSVLGQDLWLVDLQLPDAEPRYRIYIDGGHHGNEYMGVELAMAYLGYLYEGYLADDPTVLAFLEDHTVRALPLVNPDGNAADTRKNANLVDLNRNYPYEWGGEGSGDDATSFSYRGPEPLSEPETQANVAAAEAFDPDLWVTMHTGIAEFYWPWGWTHDPSPDDDMFLRIEKPFEDATNGRVDAMQAAALYLAAGATDDYGYGEHGVPSFTFEVHEDQFVPAYGDGIPAAIADQLAGLVWITTHTAHLGANVEAAAPATDVDGTTVTLTNTGWGNATNVTLDLLDAGGAVLATTVVDVPHQSSVDVRFDGVTGAASVRGTYARLHVDTSPVWTLTAAAANPPADDNLLPVPAAGPAAVAAVLGLLAVAFRRRG